MTITISPIFIYCWAFIIIIETIHAYVTWKQFKKKLTEDKYKDIVFWFKEFEKTFAAIRLAHKTIFNPFTYFAAFILLCIISPVLFLSSMKTIFKKIIGYKTKLEKEVDEQEKAFDEAQKRSDEFLKNEGRGIVENDIQEISFEDQVN